jgi:hypothetical protein
MKMSTEERLARAADVLDEHIEARVAAPAYVAEERAHARSRVPGAVAAVAAAMALVLGVTYLATSPDDAHVAAPAAPSHRLGDAGWDLLPAAPIRPRFQHVAVSTGHGLLVWGGYTGDGPRTDGAFYDARTAEWRKLPKAPLAGDRGDAIGAWTGSEVVVVNGTDGDVKAAAFDPDSFEWRALPDPPLTNAANMMARLLPTDAGVVVIAVSTEGEGGARNEVARYDEVTGSWHIGEPPPSSIGSGFDAVAVGDEVVVIGRRGVGGAGCGEARVLAYRLSTNTWRTLPPGPLEERGGPVVGLVGDEVLVAGGFECGDPTARTDSVLLDPSRGEWRPAASAPTALRGSDRYGEPSSGRMVLAIDETGSPAVYDGEADRWHRGPAHPLGTRYTETPWAWVDGRVLVFSGGLANGEGGCCKPVEGGYAYTLATPAPGEDLDARYEQCAIEAGFDPGGVQVVTSASGRPELVKTGRDVPGEIHGPCLEEIGGTDPHSSSRGNESP